LLHRYLGLFIILSIAKLLPSRSVFTKDVRPWPWPWGLELKFFGIGLGLEGRGFVCRWNISSANLRMTDYPLIGVVRVTWSVFYFDPNHIFGIVKLGTSNLVC